MTNDDYTTSDSDDRSKNFWDALSAHWFEDLPEKECLNLVERWFIATCGTGTFFLTNFLLQLETALPTNPKILQGLLLIAVSFAFGLGFLLAWKRPRTGPVRLFVSGVALPSFVLLSARIVTSIGG